MEGYFRFCICRIFPIHYSLARYRKRNPNPRVVFIPMSQKYSNWRDYQEAAAAVFRDLRCNADVEKTVKGARGEHKIDVYVTFTKFAHECCWIVECKLWSKPVPREVVHTLCSKVQDIGADRGVIFSESGFQEGAVRSKYSADPQVSIVQQVVTVTANRSQPWLSPNVFPLCA